MKKEMRDEQLEMVLEDIRDATVIVEGKRDKKALKSLGVKDIIAISGRPLYEIAEIASEIKNDIVILTDFDRKGRQLEKRLRCLLQKHGTQPNSRLRWIMMTLGKNMGKNRIEDFGVSVTSEKISFGEDDFHVKTRTNFNKIHGKSGDRRAGSNRKT